jgi:oligopeptide transport system ATP-binding protein
MSWLLEIENLETRFKIAKGTVHAVNGISMSIQRRETVGIVGESGCGKSVTMLSILGLLPQPPASINAEKITFDGEDLLHYSAEELRKIRGNRIGMIFQDPMTSFNPVLTVGRQLMEPLEMHTGMGRRESEELAQEMLSLVGIPNPKHRLTEYPHQFSGGMRQRLMIAMALICDPELLIADEPTTALDVTIQAQIVDLVKRLTDKMKMSVIWISHDLAVVAGIADRVIVMYGGTIVEEAQIDMLYENPRHPYTIGLLNSLPKGVDNERRLQPIGGMPPILMEKPQLCPFLDRCEHAGSCDHDAPPPLISLNEQHRVACWKQM